MPEVLTQVDPNDSIEKFKQEHRSSNFPLSPAEFNAKNAERKRLETEALNTLIAWKRERDPSKRTPLWYRLMDVADDLIYFNEQQEKK